MPRENQILVFKGMNAHDANKLWYLITQDPSDKTPGDPSDKTPGNLALALVPYQTDYPHSLFVKYCEWYSSNTPPERKKTLFREMLDALPEQLSHPRTAEEAYVIYQFCAKITMLKNSEGLEHSQKQKLDSIESLEKDENFGDFLRRISLFRDFAPLCHVLGAHYSVLAVNSAISPYSLSDKQLKYLKIGQNLMREAAFLGFFPAAADYILNVFNYPAFANGQGQRLTDCYSSEFLMQSCDELTVYVDDKTESYIKEKQMSGERVESFNELFDITKKDPRRQALAFQLAALALCRLLDQAKDRKFENIDRKSPLLKYIHDELNIAAGDVPCVQEAFAMQALLAYHYDGGVDRTKELIGKSKLLSVPSENDIWRMFESYFNTMCSTLEMSFSSSSSSSSLSPSSPLYESPVPSNLQPARSESKFPPQIEGAASPLATFYDSRRRLALTTPSKLTQTSKSRLSQFEKANLKNNNNQFKKIFFDADADENAGLFQLSELNTEDNKNSGVEEGSSFSFSPPKAIQEIPASVVIKAQIVIADQFNALIYIILQGFKNYKNLSSSNPECLKSWKQLVEKTTVIANSTDTFENKTKQILQAVKQSYQEIEEKPAVLKKSLQFHDLLGQLLANGKDRPGNFIKINHWFAPKKYSFVSAPTSIKAKAAKVGKIYLLAEKSNSASENLDCLVYLVKNNSGKIIQGKIDEDNFDINKSDLKTIINTVTLKRKLNPQQQDLLTNALANEGHIETCVWMDAQSVAQTTVDKLITEQVAILKPERKAYLLLNLLNEGHDLKDFGITDKLKFIKNSTKLKTTFVPFYYELGRFLLKTKKSPLINRPNKQHLDGLTALRKAAALGHEKAASAYIHAILTNPPLMDRQARLYSSDKLLSACRSLGALTEMQKQHLKQLELDHQKQIFFDNKKSRRAVLAYRLAVQLLKTHVRNSAPLDDKIAQSIEKELNIACFDKKTSISAAAFKVYAWYHAHILDNKAEESDRLKKVAEGLEPSLQENLLRESNSDLESLGRLQPASRSRGGNHMIAEQLVAPLVPAQNEESIKTSSIACHITYAVLDFYAAYKKRTNPHQGWLNILKELSSEILSIYQQEGSDDQKEGDMLKQLEIAYKKINSNNSRARHFLGDLLDCCGCKPNNFKLGLNYKQIGKKDFLQEAIIKSCEPNQLDKVIVGRHLCLELIDKLSAIKYSTSYSFGLFLSQQSISPIEEYAKNQLIFELKKLLKTPEEFLKKDNVKKFLGQLVHDKLEVVATLYQKNGCAISGRLDKAARDIDDYLSFHPAVFSQHVDRDSQYRKVQDYIIETTRRYHKFGLQTNPDKVRLAYELLIKLHEHPDVGVEAMVSEYCKKHQKDAHFFDTGKFGAMLKLLKEVPEANRNGPSPLPSLIRPHP